MNYGVVLLRICSQLNQHAALILTAVPTAAMSCSLKTSLEFTGKKKRTKKQLKFFLKKEIPKANAKADNKEDEFIWNPRNRCETLKPLRKLIKVLLNINGKD